MLIGHGGNIYAAARSIGCRPEDILDFSSNVNPLPLKDEFLNFLTAHLPSIQHLPEPDNLELREKLAARYELECENILIGPGTTQWIYDLPALLDIGRVVIVVPTYADYEDAARLARKNVHHLLCPFSLQNTQGSRWLSSLVEDLAPGDLIFFCNPNNPTGLFIDPPTLKDAITSTPDVLWCIDESYAPFIAPDEKSSLIPLGLPQNCVVLRSFSKIYGIPGLRLGAIFGPIQLIDILSRCQRPWSVARLSQLAGLYLIDRPEWKSEAREYLMREKTFLFESIKSLPYLHPIESQTHFFMIQCAPPLEVSKLSRMLLSKKILIRDCSNFKGLEGKNIFRISPRIHAENQTFLKQLKRIISDKT